MELLFYYLDSKYLPKKRAELMRALVETFQAKPFSEGVVKFKIKTIDLFARIELDFPDLYLANVETIGFHIPRNQVDRLSEKPVSELKEDKIDGIETYRFYETIESELKLAKENLEKMIEGEDIVTPKNTT